MTRQKAIFNWSGGKDSALTLYKTLALGTYDVAWLLTSVNEHFQRVSMHGVRSELLDRQAASIGIPLVKLLLPEMPDMPTYEAIMTDHLTRLKDEGAEVCIFGDIFLEDLRQYREDKLALMDLQSAFPIWKTPTDQLVREFIDLGFKATIVCVNDQFLDQSFAGRAIDQSLLDDLPPNVDPCGENGEFHSFVSDGPIFQRPVDFTLGEKVYREYPNPDGEGASQSGFWYCDLLPA